MKKSALDDKHRKQAQQMGEYRGWEMPLLYTNVELEYEAATLGTAILDRSPWGRIEVSGKDALELLHRLSTNDLLKMKAGQIAGTVFTTEKGRTIDEVTVTVRQDSLLLVSSPGSEERLITWIQKFVISEQVQLKCVTSVSTMISLVGARADSTIGSILQTDIPPNTFREVVTSCGPVLAQHLESSRTRLFNLIVRNDQAGACWEMLCRQQGRMGLQRMGMQAYEASRVSRGVPSYGAEIADAFTPLEIGLRESISFDKGCYVGQEVIARLDTYKKVHRRLVGLVVSEQPGHVRAQTALVKDTTDVGVLTTLLAYPVRGKYLGLGVVESTAVAEGDVLFLTATPKPIRAVVISLPIMLERAGPKQ